MASSFKSPILQAIDQNGNPVPGAKLFVYQTGTTTPVVIYSDQSLTTPLPNPIIANTRGYFASSGGIVQNIFWDGQALRLRLTGPDDSVIWEIDDYSALAGAALLADNNTFTGDNTFQGALIKAGSPVIAESDFVASVTVNVPSDQPTINDAIAFLSALPIRPNANFVINLEAGHELNYQVILDGGDYSNIRLTSADAEVPIIRSALTTNSFGRFPAIAAINGARMPVIDVLFNMDTSGTQALRDGIQCINGAWAYVLLGKGVKNAGGRGFHVANLATGLGRQANFSGAGEAAVRCSNAICEVRQANLSNSGKGLMLASAALVDANDANISNCTIGIEAFNAIVRAEDANLNGCAAGVELYDNAILSARSASINNATGIAALLRRGSKADLRSASLNDAGGTALTISGSSATCDGASIARAGTNAIYIVGGGHCVATNASLIDADSHGILAENGSFATCQGANATGAGASGYMINNGSTIDATTATGTTGRVANVLSRHGIIYTDGTTPWSLSATEILPAADNTQDIGSPSLRVRRFYAVDIRVGTGGDRRWLSGTGTPEGNSTAPVGSMFLRQDGGAGTTLYIKESGTGNTGWVAK